MEILALDCILLDTKHMSKIQDKSNFWLVLNLLCAPGERTFYRAKVPKVLS